MKKIFTVSDGKLMLILTPANEGGYTVTSPIDPALVTEAETIEEAFEIARDAMKTLYEGRAKLLKARRMKARAG
jgi:antitoxin HicB